MASFSYALWRICRHAWFCDSYCCCRDLTTKINWLKTKLWGFEIFGKKKISRRYENRTSSSYDKNEIKHLSSTIIKFFEIHHWLTCIFCFDWVKFFNRINLCDKSFSLMTLDALLLFGTITTDFNRADSGGMFCPDILDTIFNIFNLYIK